MAMQLGVIGAMNGIPLAIGDAMYCAITSALSVLLAAVLTDGMLRTQ